MTANAYAFAGAFTTAGTSPDGDTLRFRPDHPHHLDALSGCDRLGWSDDTVHVRLDAIDAPELHYEGERQRRSATARTRLLRRLGFTNVTLYGDYVDHAAEPRGWLVAREADLHGRVIGFVYRAADLDAHEGPITFDADTAQRRRFRTIDHQPGRRPGAPVRGTSRACPLPPIYAPAGGL